jgi:hypothetical protein
VIYFVVLRYVSISHNPLATQIHESYNVTTLLTIKWPDSSVVEFLLWVLQQKIQNVRGLRFNPGLGPFTLAFLNYDEMDAFVVVLDFGINKVIIIFSFLR